MKKALSRILVLAVALGVSTWALAAGVEGTWTGWVTETHCGEKGANAEHADCAAKCVKEKGAKWALYSPTDKTVWVLSDQDGAAKMNGKKITVKGTADKDKKEITVASMEAAK